MIKTTKWVKEHIDDIIQCEECGELNNKNNEKCIHCEKIDFFIDEDLDREYLIHILDGIYTNDYLLII